MALTPGTRLGIYDIVAPIGEGGMGEVYRARDTKLNRDVALKILPDVFASDPDRLARFTREAQTLASLNHSNIAHIHGLEEAGGVRALVMELVDGDDLAQRIARGPIPLDEAVPIAKQIAEALEAAHEQGIVHRDLKPANIKVRPDGTVKVLDFGLAKAMGQGSGIGDQGSGAGLVSMSPTLTSPAMMTGLGVILGTAAYMAPEQAKGRAVDKRADIWAFGVVVHEMLTGRRLFDAEDMSETLAAVLTREVTLTTLPPAIPARLRALLRDCLVRDPRQRLRDIGDARIALDQTIAGAPEAASPDPPAGTTPRSVVPAVLSAAAVGGIAVLLLWSPWRGDVLPDRPLVRLDVNLGDGVSLPPPSGSGSNLAISPDGTRLAFVSGTPSKLFLRRLDQPAATELPGTDGAVAPSFSPDGQWIAFTAGGQLKKIAVEGGPAIPTGAPANVNYARWLDNGSLFLGIGQKALRTNLAGGPPEDFAEIREGELSFNDAQLLPGGRAILLETDSPGPVDKTTADVVTLADHQRRTLRAGAATPRYLPTSHGTGHLIYVNRATLFGVLFDPNTLTTHGPAVPLLNDVAHDDLVGAGDFDVSRSGTLVYRKTRTGTSALTTLQWVDAAGRKTALGARAALLRDPSVSPDGRRIAGTTSDSTSVDVWIYDTQRDAMTRVTFGGKVYRSPRWSPDGRYLVFSELGSGLVQARADGASQPMPLTKTRIYQIAGSFSPDGKRLVYADNPAAAIWTMPLEDRDGHLNAGAPELFLKGAAVAFPAFSPDGRWLAYQSDESGATEVYVRAFPPPDSGLGGKWQISNNGGSAPHWSRDGRHLLYQSGDQIVTAAYSATGDTFVTEKPRVWLDRLAAATLPNGLSWDLAPDGERIAVMSPLDSAETSKPEHEVVFLLNFFDELRRRIPINK